MYSLSPQMMPLSSSDYTENLGVPFDCLFPSLACNISLRLIMHFFRIFFFIYTSCPFYLCFNTRVHPLVLGLLQKSPRYSLRVQFLPLLICPKLNFQSITKGKISLLVLQGSIQLGSYSIFLTVFLIQHPDNRYHLKRAK